MLPHQEVSAPKKLLDTDLGLRSGFMKARGSVPSGRVGVPLPPLSSARVGRPCRDAPREAGTMLPGGVGRSPFGW